MMDMLVEWVIVPSYKQHLLMRWTYFTKAILTTVFPRLCKKYGFVPPDGGMLDSHPCSFAGLDHGFPVPPYDVQVAVLRAFDKFRGNNTLWEIIWSKVNFFVPVPHMLQDEYSELVMELCRTATKLPLTFHVAQTKIFTFFYSIFFVRTD